MAERKAVNKYYPPDWDPAKGSVNKHVGQHPLRERARKLSQGILIIRFEMPYNIWCDGCGNHIGMGVRYNAEKKKVGSYYTTPVYRFRMKCHLCDNYMEIETDPKNCDYTIVSGARRKEERWEPSATENIQATDHAEKQKLVDDAMYKLEHGEKDKRKSKAAIPGLVQIKDIQSQWKDDFGLNQLLRKKFRQEKKVFLEKEEKDKEIKDKGALDIELVNEDPKDIELAKKIRFHSTGFQEDQRKRRLQIKVRPMFTDGLSVKNSKRTELLEKRQRIEIAKSTVASHPVKTSEGIVIRKGKSNDSACSSGGKNKSDKPNCDAVGVNDSKNSEDVSTNTVTLEHKRLEGLSQSETMNNSDVSDNTTSVTKEVVTKCHDERTNVLPLKEPRENISLVSEVYSDTDSDNSK